MLRSGKTKRTVIADRSSCKIQKILLYDPFCLRTQLPIPFTTFCPSKFTVPAPVRKINNNTYAHPDD